MLWQAWSCAKIKNSKQCYDVVVKIIIVILPSFMHVSRQVVLVSSQNVTIRYIHTSSKCDIDSTTPHTSHLTNYTLYMCITHHTQHTSHIIA